MADHSRPSPKSAETLLKDLLRIGQPRLPTTPSLTTGESASSGTIFTECTGDNNFITHQDPYVSPQPPFQIGAIQPETELRIIDYDVYFQEILCFSSVDGRPEPMEMIREYVQALCAHQPCKLHTRTLRAPLTSIPPGAWTLAFAPSILTPATWAIAFAAPLDSEFVWFFWPSRSDPHINIHGNNDGIEDHLLAFLAQLLEEGKLRTEDNMKVGSARHKMFWDMLAQVLWTSREGQALGSDWRIGEFGDVM